MDINDKLDLLLHKITEIDERLKKMENKTDDIHHYVPLC